MKSLKLDEIEIKFNFAFNFSLKSMFDYFSNWICEKNGNKSKVSNFFQFTFKCAHVFVCLFTLCHLSKGKKNIYILYSVLIRFQCKWKVLSKRYTPKRTTTNGKKITKLISNKYWITSNVIKSKQIISKKATLKLFGVFGAQNESTSNDIMVFSILVSRRIHWFSPKSGSCFFQLVWK